MAVYNCIKNTKTNEFHYSRQSPDRSVVAIFSKCLPISSVLTWTLLFVVCINSFNVHSKETPFLNKSVIRNYNFLLKKIIVEKAWLFFKRQFSNPVLFPYIYIPYGIQQVRTYINKRLEK